MSIDKARKQLERVLSDHPIKSKESPKMLENGELTIKLEEKLGLFFRYYQNVEDRQRLPLY